MVNSLDEAVDRLGKNIDALIAERNRLQAENDALRAELLAALTREGKLLEKIDGQA